VLSALHAFATAAVDIESSARGYALTGTEAYLQPFELARRQAPQRLDELRDLLRADPKELGRVERLTSLLAERIALSEFAIAQKRGAPDEPSVARLAPRGRETSDEIRRIVEDIEADQRHDLASRKIAWQQELESTRTSEALSALTSLTVITLSLWALLRLRRTEAPAPTVEPVSAPAVVTPPTPPAPPAADFESLVDETLRRTALLQSSHPVGSAERARVETLRSAIESARSGASPADALVVIERLGLPLALSALARDVRERLGCTVRESIDSTTQLPPAHAALLFGAADWALVALCMQAPVGEVGIGLASDDTHVVARVESPNGGEAALDAELDARAAKLSQQVVALGGAWQWNASDNGRSLTVTLPTSWRSQSTHDTPEPARA
jgi:CHASE3 domain sensor protein